MGHPESMRAGVPGPRVSGRSHNHETSLVATRAALMPGRNHGLHAVPRPPSLPGIVPVRAASGGHGSRRKHAGHPPPAPGERSVRPAEHVVSLTGFRVDGRHGRLGIVIDAESEGREVEQAEILVRGGASDALYYHVPTAVVTVVSRERRTVTLDLDVIDFTPRLRDDGSVDLYLVQD